MTVFRSAEFIAVLVNDHCWKSCSFFSRPVVETKRAAKSRRGGRGRGEEEEKGGKKNKRDKKVTMGGKRGASDVAEPENQRAAGCYHGNRLITSAPCLP